MSNTNIHDDKINVNSQKGSSIEMCPHEEDLPFTMVPVQLIRNKEISPECREIIIQLISNKPGWRINIAQLVNFYDGYWGRDKVYKFFNQAIEAGYIKKIICREGKNNNRFGKIKYIVSRTPKFKEKIPVTCFQEADGTEAENTHFKKNDREERSSDIYKKNDSVSVHNLEPKKSKPSATAPLPAAPRSRSSCIHTSTAPLPAAPIASKNSDGMYVLGKGNLHDIPPFDPATFDPDTYRLPSGARLSRQCANAFKKYNDDQRANLFANIEHFEKQYRKNPHMGKPEAYLQKCINQNYAGKELERYQNWIFAEYVIKENNLKHVILMKTIVKKEGKYGDSISLSLPPYSFADALESFLGIRKA